MAVCRMSLRYPDADGKSRLVFEIISGKGMNVVITFSSHFHSHFELSLCQLNVGK